MGRTKWGAAIRTAVLACAAGAALCSSPVRAWDDGGVPFVVSPDEVVERMLRIADVGKDDILIDLGSGDGRIVIAAARRGAQAYGVDLDPALVARARANAERAGVATRARFEVRDMFETALDRASVITLYLLPEFNLKLMPRLLALAPGTRVVSHDWDMGAWKPDETMELYVPEKSVGVDLRSRIYLWVVPADARGAWTSEVPGSGAWEFRIGQDYQALKVDATVRGRSMVVRGARLRGDRIRIATTGTAGVRPGHYLFEGVLHDGRIDGRVQVTDADGTRSLPWMATRTR